MSGLCFLLRTQQIVPFYLRQANIILLFPMKPEKQYLCILEFPGDIFQPQVLFPPMGRLVWDSMAAPFAMFSLLAPRNRRNEA